MRHMLFLMAVVLYAQTATDPAEVLDSVRAKIRAAMKHLPKYACLQTVDRTYYAPPAVRPGGTSCDQLSADKGKSLKPLRVNAADRLRIEVAQGMDKEIHSWPGASRFDLTEIDQIVDNGPFATGSFGGYLGDIFDNDSVQFDYRGESRRDNKRVLVFGFAVAPEVSHYEVRTGDSWVTTAYSGTFEVEADSVEISRVTIQTTELPEESGLCEATSTLDYEYFRIGEGSFLLPRQNQLRLILRDGNETNNSVVFSGCREFRVRSKLRFDNPIDKLEVATAPGRPRSPLPSGLGVDLRLNAPIDTDTSAAGDVVSATLVHAVHAFRTDEILIPAGAVVHGRISRIEHHFSPAEYWLIGFAFESVEFNGESSRFAVRTELPDHYYGTVPIEVIRTLLRRIPPPPPDSLIFPHVKRYVMSVGTVTHWITWTQPKGAVK